MEIRPVAGWHRPRERRRRVLGRIVTRDGRPGTPHSSPQRSRSGRKRSSGGGMGCGVRVDGPGLGLGLGEE
jgi:hypothetical protein